MMQMVDGEQRRDCWVMEPIRYGPLLAVRPMVHGGVLVNNFKQFVVTPTTWSSMVQRVKSVNQGLMIQ